MPGAAVEDYVKVIYKISLSRDRVTPSHVAGKLGVSSAAVSKMVRRLAELKLVRYSRADGLSLTPAGEKIALEVIRHHRLIELYLTEALGYTWDQVHEEAEKLEHVISEHFEEKIEALLGYPTRDPHGHPIPTRDGRVETVGRRKLSDLEPGEHGLVERVSDADAGMLAYLGKLGMYPGTSVELVAGSRFGGSYRVRVAGVDHSVGREVADNVFVDVKESPE